MSGLILAVALGALGAVALCPRPRRPAPCAAWFAVANLGLLALVGARRAEALLIGLLLAWGGALRALREAGWGEPRAQRRAWGVAQASLGLVVIGVGCLVVATGAGRLVPLAWAGGGAVAGWLPGAGVILIGLGLSSALGVFPWAGWLPELLADAPAGLGLWLCVSFPAAALGALSHALSGAVGLEAWLPGAADPRQWLAPLGVASATLSLWVALRGTSLTRTLAHLAAAQYGLLLLGLACRTEPGWGPLEATLAAAALTNGAGFALAAALQRERAPGLRALVGLAARAPAQGALWGLVLASHAGLPLTLGFLGRLQLLLIGVAAPLWPSYLLLAALDLALAAAVALRMGRLLLHPSPASAARSPSRDLALAGVLGALLLVLGVWPGALVTP